MLDKKLLSGYQIIIFKMSTSYLFIIADPVYGTSDAIVFNGTKKAAGIYIKKNPEHFYNFLVTIYQNCPHDIDNDQHSLSGIVNKVFKKYGGNIDIDCAPGYTKFIKAIKKELVQIDDEFLVDGFNSNDQDSNCGIFTRVNKLNNVLDTKCISVFNTECGHSSEDDSDDSDSSEDDSSEDNSSER